ncbi:HU family DNA-binding protein [Salipiger sp. PrR003]|uniref:HU family DNA-binding protein n=1 Tax=Salipiger sp. PrR003 TaxID=2706776 RepID=UPI0013DA22A7|nr:HU family DNA-binding protein [Salipiger sp. PrR003]NDV52933.1 DNA-binding protein HU [Salipiger sp. PrR003]
MNRVEIEAKVAEDLGVPRRQVTDVVTAFLETVGDAIGDGQDVRIFNFGSWRVTTRKACDSRNPATGEVRHIPESQRVSFRPGNRLKEKLKSGPSAD